MVTSVAVDKKVRIVIAEYRIILVRLMDSEELAKIEDHPALGFVVACERQIGENIPDEVILESLKLIRRHFGKAARKYVHPKWNTHIDPVIKHVSNTDLLIYATENSQEQYENELHLSADEELWQLGGNTPVFMSSKGRQKKKWTTETLRQVDKAFSKITRQRQEKGK